MINHIKTAAYSCARRLPRTLGFLCLPIILLGILSSMTWKTLAFPYFMIACREFCRSYFVSKRKPSTSGYSSISAFSFVNSRNWSIHSKDLLCVSWEAVDSPIRCYSSAKSLFSHVSKVVVPYKRSCLSFRVKLHCSTVGITWWKIDATVISPPSMERNFGKFSALGFSNKASSNICLDSSFGAAIKKFDNIELSTTCSPSLQHSLNTFSTSFLLFWEVVGSSFPHVFNNKI